jgi:hypothetical protein
LRTKTFLISAFAVSMSFATGAFAQDPGQTTVGAGEPSQNLPPPQSDNDPQPLPPSPMVQNPSGVTEQAGVGGTQAYGRAGVLELGGSAALLASDGFTSVNVSPSIGWFFADNMQISFITGLSYGKADGADSSTFFKAVLEPSFHIPFSDVIYGFLGLGVGTAYNGDEFGFDLAPRVGANFLIGRSGVLTPAFVVDYSTVQVVNTQAGSLLAVKTAFGLQIGYTVMW